MKASPKYLNNLKNISYSEFTKPFGARKVKRASIEQKVPIISNEVPENSYADAITDTDIFLSD